MFGKKFFALLLALVLALSSFGLAAAEEHVPACEGDEVIGRVTSVDEEAGQMVILTESGECYVSLGQEFDHPIVGLFAGYFGADAFARYADALAGLDGWASYDETTLTWQWNPEEDEGTSPSTLGSLVDNGDGTYTLELTVEGEADPIFVLLTDPDEIAYYMELFDATSVEFSLTQDGEGKSFVSGVGDDVMAYREGYHVGFGILVKFYSLAATSDFTVDDLITMFKDGKVGLGKIFRETGRPEMMGVGQIKQALKEDEQGSLESAEHGKNNKDEKQNNGKKPEDKGNKGKKNE